MFHGKTHYFDWAMFNSKLLVYQRVTSIVTSVGFFKKPPFLPGHLDRRLAGWRWWRFHKISGSWKLRIFRGWKAKKKRIASWFCSSCFSHLIDNSGEITLWLWLTVRHGFSMALIEIDDFPSELNLHLWLGFSMAMLVITSWFCSSFFSPFFHREIWGNDGEISAGDAAPASQAGRPTAWV